MKATIKAPPLRLRDKDGIPTFERHELIDIAYRAKWQIVTIDCELVIDMVDALLAYQAARESDQEKADATLESIEREWSKAYDDAQERLDEAKDKIEALRAELRTRDVWTAARHRGIVVRVEFPEDALASECGPIITAIRDAVKR